VAVSWGTERASRFAIKVEYRNRVDEGGWTRLARDGKKLLVAKKKSGALTGPQARNTSPKKPNLFGVKAFQFMAGKLQGETAL